MGAAREKFREAKPATQSTSQPAHTVGHRQLLRRHQAGGHRNCGASGMKCRGSIVRFAVTAHPATQPLLSGGLTLGSRLFARPYFFTDVIPCYQRELFSSLI